MRWWLGAILLLTAGLVFQLGLLVYAMYVLLGLLLLTRYLAQTWIDNIVVTRVGERNTAEIGEEIEVRVTVHNRGRWRVPWLIVEESLPRVAMSQNPPRLRVKGRTLQLWQLPAGSAKQLSYRVRIDMRGLYQLGPLLIESGDLFGLHRRYRIATEPHFVLVLPRTVEMADYDLASRRPMGEVRISHRLFEDPTRINGVRPYQIGDPLNRIHWRATARTGQLHSKTCETSCVAGATLLLDFHQESQRGNGSVVRTELAITTVASLARAVCEQGQQVGFISNGRDAADRIRQEGWRHEFRTRAAAQARAAAIEGNDRLRPVRVETRRGLEQLPRILEALARLEPTDGMNFAQLLDETCSRLPRDATVVAVLTEISQATAVALGSLRRRGYAVTAVLVLFDEVELHQWAQPPGWAGRLMAEGIDFRRVNDETGLGQLCAGHLIR